MGQEIILIHTALMAEARALIEKFKLNFVSKNPKIYKKDNIILVVSGVGTFNTKKALEKFKNYNIKKAINIGVVGGDKIGKIFVIDKTNDNILKTFDTPVLKKQDFLVDMEYSQFKKFCIENNIDFLSIKIVSDNFDGKITKEFVYKLILDKIDTIRKIVLS